MPHDLLLALIKDYILTAENVVEMMRQHYNIVDLISAWRHGAIPRHGRLPSGLTFHFHGVGCRFELNGVNIDIDFGPEGCCDGFDAWRLFEFSRAGRAYDPSITLESITNGLAQLQNVGIVEKPSILPSPHLMYLVQQH